MDNSEIKHIIKQCIEQDRVAQKQLFKMFYGKMLGVALRYIKDRDQAQEIVQESFIKIFDRMIDFDFKGSFEGWIKRIVANTAIDTIRKNKRSPFLTDENYIFDSQYTEQEHQLDDDVTHIKAEIAMEAIRELSPAYRTVFNLYVVENYTHAEIAEILNISEGTSKSNLAKAKMNLRNILIDKYTKIEN